MEENTTLTYFIFSQCVLVMSKWQLGLRIGKKEILACGKITMMLSQRENEEDPTNTFSYQTPKSGNPKNSTQHNRKKNPSKWEELLKKMYRKRGMI